MPPIRSASVLLFHKAEYSRRGCWQLDVATLLQLAEQAVDLVAGEHDRTAREKMAKRLGFKSTALVLQAK